ncbi:hypothetical protein [Actinoplanes sp. NPDC026623]|uniref:hypothetical protein n=1 Tax=Actinoplanes sp. NPDC026623 TaxID=3155610 RepID=UPI0034057188
MLSGIQIQAITRCLTDLEDHGQRTQHGSGENLLAVLQETPVAGHPDSTARHLGVNPLPVPPEIWSHPDGPVAALHQAHDDMRGSGVQDQLTRVTDVRFLAWVYLYTETVDDEDGPVTIRVIDAVDIDERTKSVHPRARRTGALRSGPAASSRSRIRRHPRCPEHPRTDHAHQRLTPRHTRLTPPARHHHHRR